MPVTDFECQIARGQIDRYLQGGMLSPQAMKGLEEHLVECPECKGRVADRRAALLGALGGEVPVRAVVSLPKTEENPLVAALRARAATESEVEVNEAKPKAKTAPRYAKASKKETPAKPQLTKPLALAALLAAVLIGMSYLTRGANGQGVLGGKADAAFASHSLPDAAPVVETPKPEVPKAELSEPQPEAALPAETSKASAPDPAPSTPPATVVSKPKPEPTQPLVAAEKPAVAVKPTPAKPVPAPKTVAKAPTAPKARRKAVRRFKRAKAPSSNGSVRVYGLDGRPLKP